VSAHPIHLVKEQLIDRLRGVDPRAVDSILALVFAVAALWTIAERVGDQDPFRSDGLLGIVLVLAQTLPLAVRRVAPIRALALSVAAVSIHIALGYEGVPAGTFAALVILYTAASMSDTHDAMLAAAITAAGIAIYFISDRSDPGVTAAVTTSATYAAAWGLGVYVHSRREYTTIVEERANLLERERELRSREAVAEERARIARELHDMVGHALSLIVIQSGGAQRALQSKPALVGESLGSIEAISREALADMERMLGIINAPDSGEDTLSPQPGLSDVETLAARVSEAGLPVNISVEGLPFPLPASVDLSAYRIIQEALTNALKHAGPAHVSVRIRYDPEGIELEIVDDGRGVNRDGHDEIHGRGLIGMRERVTLYGGELTTGPRQGGGYRVRAKLPLTSGA
jgi:signal transduction histidine kinase